MASIETRTNDDGGTAYRVKVRLKGYKSQTATFERLTDARQWAQKIESDMRRGRYFEPLESAKRTLKETLERYEREILPTKRPRTQAVQSPQIRFWTEALGEKLLKDVTPAVIGEARAKLKATPTYRKGPRSDADVNRALALLSHVFSVASREWQWATGNPAKAIKKRPEAPGRVRFLTAEERAALLREARASRAKALYPAVLLSLSTGARRQEILSLAWAQVDYDGERILIEQTKNKERRAVPLVPAAAEALREWGKVRHLRTDLVFPGRSKGKPAELRAAFTEAVARAGLADFHWHDMRHDCASYLATQGLSLLEIGALLGHKSPTMTKRYSHLAADALAVRVTDRLGGMFAKKEAPGTVDAAPGAVSAVAGEPTRGTDGT